MPKHSRNPAHRALSLPRWYLIALSILFACYLSGWFYTIHLAAVERAAGEEFIMPVGPHDSTSYANLTNSVLQGHFAEGAEQHEYFHTPGYPVFAAVIRFIFGGSFFAVTFVQILLVFATALMIVALGGELVSLEVGLWASLLFLLNPLVPSIALYVLTDTLFMFLLTLAFLIIVRYTRKRFWTATIAAGFCFALAVYVRPIGFVALPIFFAPLLALSMPLKKKFIAGAAMLLIIGALLLPWMLRNNADSGVFSFSSTFPLNMAYYEIPDYLVWHNHMTFGDARQKVVADSGVPQGLDSYGYPANWYNLSYSPALENYVVKTVEQSFVSYASWHILNSSGFFLNPAINPPNQSVNLKRALVEGRIGEFLQAVATPWWLLAERIALAFGLLATAFGFWRLRRLPLTWAFLFVILYLGVLGGPEAASRLRLPVEPIMSIFTVAGLVALYGWYQRHQKSKFPLNAV